MNHPFLHCAMARELWSMIFLLFGVFWVMSHSMQEMSSWRGRFGGRSNGGELGKGSPSVSCGVYGEKGMLIAFTCRS